MNRADNIIAIDPDVHKSGVAYLKPATQKLEVSNLTFPQLLDYLQFCCRTADDSKQSLIVVVEAGWLNQKSCFHSAQGRGVERISKNVGANHQVGKLIIECCENWGIEVVEQRPLTKCWQGKDGKITAEELKTFTGLTGHTNQDGRDAALLAWMYADLPIYLSSK